MTDTLPGMNPEVRRDAVLSTCGRYRYALRRMWGEPGSARATFIMLNPSTADADVDDATIRRCMGFARAWGCGGLEVLNLYALRSTDPAGLWDDEDPVGAYNDFALVLGLQLAHRLGWPIVAAWGAHAKPERVREVLEVCAMAGVDSLSCLGTTKAGQPRHPLYLPADTPLTPWRTP